MYKWSPQGNWGRVQRSTKKTIVCRRRERMAGVFQREHRHTQTHPPTLDITVRAHTPTKHDTRNNKTRRYGAHAPLSSMSSCLPLSRVCKNSNLFEFRVFLPLQKKCPSTHQPSPRSDARKEEGRAGRRTCLQWSPGHHARTNGRDVNCLRCRWWCGCWPPLPSRSHTPLLKL